MSNKQRPLVDQEKALDSFFDDLLRDVEAYAEQEQTIIETAATTKPARKTSSPSEDVTASANVHTMTPRQQTSSLPLPAQKTQVTEEGPSIFERMPAVEAAIAPAREVIEKQKPVATPESVVVKQDQPEPESTEVETGKPAWAEHEFQAMLFKVAGLTLAVPLVDLNGVIEWDEEIITEMPGHADFYLGLMNHLGKNVPLVDTAKLVLPPDKLKLLAGDDPLARLSRVVLIHDNAYGLACDDVNEVIILKPEDVRWRTSRTQRRWLAGTVIEHMCALIDAREFASLLQARSPVDAFRD